MLLLVFSDSHGTMQAMEAAVSFHQPDYVLHLGDCVEDFLALHSRFSEIPMEHVPGNCDYGAEGPLTKLLTLEHVPIMLTHGHQYGVKSGYLRVIYAAREQQADILLFGHTHHAECFQEGSLWVMNPGAAKNGSYGIITLNQDGIQCRLAHQDGKERYDAAYH